MILPALLLATLAAAPNAGEEEPVAAPLSEERPAAPLQAAPSAPPVQAEPSTPPLQQHPAPPEPAPSPPTEREPEPCRPTTGSTVATGCSPSPDAPPDPSQPRTRRTDEQEKRDGLVGWADAGHGKMEEGITGLLRRIDGFFGDPTNLRYDAPPFSARLRGGVRILPDGTLSDQSSVVADVRLPSIDRALSRARIFVAGGSDDDPAQSTAAEQGVLPPRTASVGTSRGALEARYDLLRAHRTLVDVGAGVRFRWLPTPYTRIRVAHAEELGLRLVGHISQTGFWEQTVGFGESTRLDLERVLGPDTVAHAWGIGTLHERSRGLEFAAELGVAQALGRRNGMYVAGALQGATRPEQVDRYRVYTRLRRDVHDAWLFAELEPEVYWPRLPTGTRPAYFAVTLRLEVQLASRAR